MHMFGLTGGIASGKSAVAARFKARGVKVIDADVIAREVVQKGSEGLAAVVAAFGPEVLTSDGELDRKKVADLVFRNGSARGKLNGIIHPRIGALSMKRATELAAQGEALVCYEAALIVENGMTEMVRPLVVVSAPEEAQVTRGALRDSAREEDVRARIAAQMPLAAKVAVADIVIENTGTLAELFARADVALERVCTRVGVDAAKYPRTA